MGMRMKFFYVSLSLVERLSRNPENGWSVPANNKIGTRIVTSLIEGKL